MTKRVHVWVDRQLALAEGEGACLLAMTQGEARRLRRAAGVVEVVPSGFVREEYWRQLRPSDKMLHRMRALQQAHPNWVFAGPSAAVAYGLAVSKGYLDAVWVATSRRTHRRQTQSRRSIVVSGDRTESQNGLRTTSFARTVGDCLRIMDFRSGLAVADSALHATGLEPMQLVIRLDQTCERMTGINRMRALVALADARSEGGGESIARATMLELGVSVPDLQRVFENPVSHDGYFRADYAWDVDGGCILGELDGFEKYVSAEMAGNRAVAQVIREEHRRQSLLEAHQDVLRVVRFGMVDVMHERDFLDLLVGCGVPRMFGKDGEVLAAGGVLRCRQMAA